MKSIIKFVAFILLLGLFFHISCQKELSCENCKSNKPPIANAGTDQIIVLPKDSVMMYGSASTDPGNNIIAYAWTKIPGPSSFTIANANAVQTSVSNLCRVFTSLS